jgi:hypothetical protein
MTMTDLALILRMRAATEQARMSDLERLLPVAASGDAMHRRTNLGQRITARSTWAKALPNALDGWADLQEGADESAQLVDELIALLMTKLLRAEGVDRGTFDAAEALLAQLTENAGVPALVLGHTQELESVNHHRGSVALRFPGTRVWDLPFLAHEFGHHAVAHLRHLSPDLPDRRPLQDVVTRTASARDVGREGDQALARAHELVADAFATVACGPSYPIACLTLRVPRGAAATKAVDKHPAWSERISVMRATLDTLTHETRLGRYSTRRSTDIDPLARSILGALPSETAAADQAAAGTVTAILKHRSGVLFRAADDGIDVAAALEARSPHPPPRATPTTVLDGAWRWRLDNQDPRAEDAAARLVTSYCRPISSGGSP